MIKLERNIIKFLYKLKYKSRRVIKRFMMNYCFIPILKRRKLFESKRQQYEDNTTNILLERAFVTLDNLLEDDEGQRYFNLIKKKQDELRGKKVKMFPTYQENVEIFYCYTDKAKAKLVVKKRVEYEVRLKSLLRFRTTSAPLYSCNQCHKTFAMQCIYKNHKKTCSKTKHNQYLCWDLSNHLVEECLRPLQAIFKIEEHHKQ